MDRSSLVSRPSRLISSALVLINPGRPRNTARIEEDRLPKRYYKYDTPNYSHDYSIGINSNG